MAKTLFVFQHALVCAEWFLILVNAELPIQVGMSGHEQWRQEFDQQPLRVAHRADCHGLELQLEGPGPWKAGKKNLARVLGTFWSNPMFPGKTLCATAIFEEITCF